MRNFKNYAKCENAIDICHNDLMVHNKFWDTQLIKIKQTIVSTTVRQQEPPDRGTLSNHREAGSFCTGSGGSSLDKLHLDLNL